MSDERGVTAIDRRIGQRVRTRRLEIGMSQERLAEILGITFQQVQKYEKGVNRIAASRLFDIAAALDMPIARFFEGIGASRGKAIGSAPESLVEEVLATSDGMQLITLFASISSVKVRRRALDLVRTLAHPEIR